MEQHDGSLTATSKGLSFGTTFQMTLPLYDIPIEAPPPSLLMQMPSTSTSSSSSSSSSEEFIERSSSKSIVAIPEVESQQQQINRRRILIVDDSNMNRKLLIRLLKNRGHVCEEACDGQEAVDRVKKSMNTPNDFDTILLDNEMPIMKGPDACFVMRNELHYQGCILGLTGNVMREDVDIFLKAGANDVLAKPFQMAELETAWMNSAMKSRK
jgi:CheY-like chemotaxis protein